MISWRRNDALGTAAGALLAAGLVTLVGLAVYLRTHNQGQQVMAQAPAVAYARALATKARDTLDRPAELQRFVDRLSKNGQPVHLATVIAEPPSVKYRFLRHRVYLAHNLPARAGTALSPGVPGDKAFYDLCSRVRARGASLQLSSPADGPFLVSAAEPVLVDGEHRATALVITRPVAPPAPAPAWPLGLGLALCVGLGLLAGSRTGRDRGRYSVVLVLTALQACLAAWLLGTLAGGYQDALAAVAHKLAASLGQARDAGAAASLLRGLALDAPAIWAVHVSAAAGLCVGVLGLLGVGRRVVHNLLAHRFAYAYILPAAAGMLLLVFVPFGYGVALGFFNHSHGTYTFVGLDNFIEILGGGGRPLTHPLNFYFTLGVTVLWTASNVLLHVALGLALALLLKDPLLRFKGVYRVALILPWAMPNYITALIWKGMFHQQYGAVNHLLSMLGIEKISWFSSFSTAFIANLTTNVWLGFPFMMVVSLGALQSIPEDVYEAASVDGASRWQSFWNITMPLLRPALFPAIVLGTIWTFNQFNIIYLVSGGAPAGSTDILITEAYRWAFERADRYGLAAAYALIIFFILLGYTLLSNRLTRASEDAG